MNGFLPGLAQPWVLSTGGPDKPLQICLFSARGSASRLRDTDEVVDRAKTGAGDLVEYKGMDGSGFWPKED